MRKGTTLKAVGAMYLNFQIYSSFEFCHIS
nr:unnamed protein product [Callosobruchus chinensis]